MEVCAPLPPAQALTLQTVCLPEPGLAADESLFLRRNAGAEPDPRGGLRFLAGGGAEFGSYFNLLDLDAWAARCRLNGLWLQFRGKGRFTLRVERFSAQDATAEGVLLLSGEITLTVQGVALDLGRKIAGGGVIVLSMTALTPAWMHDGRFVTRAPPENPQQPFSLAVVITTYRREAAVTRSIARLSAMLATGRLNGQPARLFVIDNGQSLALADHPSLTLIANRNLGGSGGFARGLLAAEKGGFSHCLFMDDDAACLAESLVRSVAFLRLARNPATALAGAMIATNRPWQMWENGARFDRVCRPRSQGADLRKFRDVLTLQAAALDPAAANFYGGWWFFAFPLSRARSYPFPFFVRGDDISFSLANGFDIATLNGVVSWQPSFAAKESPLTLYLDLRSHLHHHLTWPGLAIGRIATAKVALWFVGRALAKMHYESAEALLWAWQDMMKGPGHFGADPGLVARRAAIAGLTRQEAWVAADAPATGPAKPLPRLLASMMKLTLNGHLLPFYNGLGKSQRLHIDDRGPIWPVWGAARLCYGDAATGRGYVVQHDKTQFWRLAVRTAGLTWRWLRAYPRLVQSYRDGYGPIASRSYWEAQFAADLAADTAQETPG